MSPSTAAVRQEISSIPSARIPTDAPMTLRHGIGSAPAGEKAVIRHRTGSTRIAGHTARRFANAGPDCFWEITSDG